jgi:hypothetical protein
MREFLFFFDIPAVEAAQSVSFNRFWLFLPVGYLATILIETPVLVFGLSPKLSLKQKLLCGVWLTACTYPVVILVLPALLLAEPDSSKTLYLAVAETFAPVAECLIFWLVFRGREFLAHGDWVRSFAAIVAANLLSFGIGEIINYYGWFGLF